MPRKTTHTAVLDPVERMLVTARKIFFVHGYSALTMDELARELGMSKKTLYLHFPSKDAIVEQILHDFIAQIRASADELFQDKTMGFTTKLRRFSAAMVNRLRVNAHILRDLQRSAPHLFSLVEELRNNNIPYVFGQILREGQAAGMVRADLDPAFAVEFWRPAIQSLMHPDSLERLQLNPDQMFTQAIDLFFGGLLTPAGRKDYEKSHPS